MKEMIKYEMENAFKLDVPLDVELELVRLAGSH
jgi:DNA polymerase I-like protein with 3'-5' exonuclease and polymerase domains